MKNSCLEDIYRLLYELLHLGQASLILHQVLSHIFMERIFVFGEVSFGPGKGRNIHTLDRIYVSYMAWCSDWLITLDWP